MTFRSVAKKSASFAMKSKVPSRCVVGIEIGGTKIQLVLGTPAGRIFERRRYPVIRAHGAKGIRRHILKGLAELRKIHKFAAIGVGFGGPIDWRTGRIFKSHHIAGWDGFDLRGWLGSKWRVPVFADNDCNVAALGEARLGSGRGCDPVFYMTIGTGIGGGIVHGGRIYHACHPGEVEVGHTRIPRTGAPPRQWPILQALCAGWSLDRQIRAAARARPGSALGRLTRDGRGGETRHLLAACRAGDRAARQIRDDLCRHLALGLSHVVHLFHPRVLILGGGVSQMGAPLLRQVRKHLRELVMTAYRGTCVVRLAALGEDAVPVGALLLTAD